MIAKGANVYLKPNDIISHHPTLFGMHEPHIDALGHALAADGLMGVGLLGTRFTMVEDF